LNSRACRTGFNRIPLIAEAFADLETPLSLYLKLAYAAAAASTASCSNRSSAASASGAIRSSACRRARCCARPASHRGGHRRCGGRGARRQSDGLHRRLPGALQGRPAPGLPRFCGGLAGYFGYDAVRYIEPRLAKAQKTGGLDTPDILLLQCEELAVIDNLSGRLYLMVYADPAEPEAFHRAKRRLAELHDKLRYSVTAPAVKRGQAHGVEREFSKDAYLTAVLKSKEYIAAGDMMQVQIGQRLRKRYTESPLSLYRALRSLNPSPYMYFYDMGDFPDRRRIAGDPGAPRAHARRRYGDDPPTRGHAAARRHARAGQGARSRAVHGPEGARRAPDAHRPRPQRHRAIAKTGSVKVTEAFVVERYSHVMHIVSNVEGLLKDGMSNLTC
jgi:anthranilate synthase component 1